MRHGKTNNHLSRKKGHRIALFKNLAAALIKYKRINTTVAKAKALRKFIEPLITKAKSNTTHSRRIVFAELQSNDAVAELFGPVATKIGSRPGGYTRVIRLGFRKGDGAEMALIELVDFNEVMLQAPTVEGAAETAKKRTRRGSKAKSGGAATATAEEATAEEAKSEN